MEPAELKIKQIFTGSELNEKSKLIYPAIEVVEYLSSFRISSRKSPCRYASQLLGIPEVTTRIAEWIRPDAGSFEQSILQFASDFYNKKFILYVIEKRVENFTPPIEGAKIVKKKHQPKEANKLMRFFHEKGVDLNPLKKEIMDLFTEKRKPVAKRIKKVVRELIQFFTETSSIITEEDKFKIGQAFNTAIISFNQFHSRNEQKYPRLGSGLIQLYHYAIKDDPKHPTFASKLTKISLRLNSTEVVTSLKQNRLLNFFCVSYAELISHLIDKQLDDQAVSELATSCLYQLQFVNSPKLSDLLAKLLSMPCMKGNTNIKNDILTRMFRIICRSKFSSKNLTAEYFELFRPALELWVLGPVFPSRKEIAVIISIEMLPTDLIIHFLGFLSYKFVQGFSMTSKKFNKFVKNNFLIWKDKFKKYFPLGGYAKDPVNEISFRKKYTTKFVPKSWRMLTGHTEALRSMEVDKNYLIWTTQRRKIGVYDLEKLQNKQMACEDPDSKIWVRSYNDTIFRRNAKGKLDLYSKFDFKNQGSFENLPVSEGSDIDLNFAVNEKWLIGSSVIFDYQKGSVIQTLDKTFQYCTVYNGICYGLSGNQIYAIDPRQPKVANQIQLSSDSCAKFSIYDGTIYTVSRSIEIVDIRQNGSRRKSNLDFTPNQPVFGVIDLVSMNAWTNRCVVDLTDLSWGQFERLPNIRFAVCNGKSIIYAIASELYELHLPGTQYAPINDFHWYS